MKLVIDIPEEQIKKSLKESEFVLEDEGIKGSVNIFMLYTNGKLEFVNISRREDFYSCDFTLLPKGYGRLINAHALYKEVASWGMNDYEPSDFLDEIDRTPTIIEADTTRDCKTCGHSNNGKCAGTEECHDCMWESKYEQQSSGDCISRQSVDILVDELARAISDERRCISRGRSAATIMQDILDLPPVTPLPFINKPCMKAR